MKIWLDVPENVGWKVWPRTNFIQNFPTQFLSSFFFFCKLCKLSNASNFSYNFKNLRCWIKLWMHLRRIYYDLRYFQQSEINNNNLWSCGRWFIKKCLCSRNTDTIQKPMKLMTYVSVADTIIYCYHCLRSALISTRIFYWNLWYLE